MQCDQPPTISSGLSEDALAHRCINAALICRNLQVCLCGERGEKNIYSGGGGGAGKSRNQLNYKALTCQVIRNIKLNSLNSLFAEKTFNYFSEN